MATVHVLLCLCKLIFKGLDGEAAPKTWGITSASSTNESQSKDRSWSCLLWYATMAGAFIHLDSTTCYFTLRVFLPLSSKVVKRSDTFLKFPFFCFVFLFRYRYAAEMVSPYVTAQRSHPRSNNPRSAPTFPWGGCNPCLTAPWRYCEHLTVGAGVWKLSFHLFCGWCTIKNITGVRAGTEVHSLRDVGSGVLLSAWHSFLLLPASMKLTISYVVENLQ